MRGTAECCSPFLIIMNNQMFKIVDIHSHVLWGVDDGPETFEESCELLRDMVSQGLAVLVLTPHYSRRYAAPSDREVLQEKLKELQEVFHSVQIVLGQELRWHEELPERIYSGAAIPINEGKYILVEFEPEDPFDTIALGLRKIREIGRIPVLAHVERYRSLDYGKISEIRHGGTLIQMNYESLHGNFLDRETARCRKLVRENLVDLLSSDVHDRDQRAFFGKKTAQLCEKLYGRERTEQLMYINPARIVGVEPCARSSSRCELGSTE